MIARKKTELCTICHIFAMENQKLLQNLRNMRRIKKVNDKVIIYKRTQKVRSFTRITSGTQSLKRLN